MGHVDAMSRLPLAEESIIEEVEVSLNALSSNEILDIGMIRKYQQNDVLLQQVYKNVKYGWSKNESVQLKEYFKIKNNFGIENGILLFNDRVIVPEKLKEEIVKLFHDNHNGLVRMKMAARKLVWWKNMDKDFHNFITLCQICQSRQIIPKEVVTTKWPKSLRPFERIHIDFF